MSIVVRAARPGDAALLSDLAFRSKAHWGYSGEFMEASRKALTVHGTCTDPTFVAEIDGKAAGFYQLRDGEMEMLFVEPDLMGSGVGRTLWEHAVETARDLGWRQILILSDPYAEGFYLAMGAERVGEAPSDVFGAERPLPRLRATL